MRRIRRCGLMEVGMSLGWALRFQKLALFLLTLSLYSTYKPKYKLSALLTVISKILLVFRSQEDTLNLNNHFSLQKCQLPSV